MKKKRIKKIVSIFSKTWKIIREIIETIVGIIAIYKFIENLMQ